MIFHDPEFQGLAKIISGGQRGADQGGLYAARDHQIQTGGWAPKGFITREGRDPSLAVFGLLEHSSSSYNPRTVKNIQDSRGTVVIASNKASPETALTITTCKNLGKPLLMLMVAEHSSLNLQMGSAAVVSELQCNHETKVSY